MLVTLTTSMKLSTKLPSSCIYYSMPVGGLPMRRNKADLDLNLNLDCTLLIFVLARQKQLQLNSYLGFYGSKDLKTAPNRTFRKFWLSCVLGVCQIAALFGGSLLTTFLSSNPVRFTNSHYNHSSGTWHSFKSILLTCSLAKKNHDEKFKEPEIFNKQRFLKTKEDF